MAKAAKVISNTGAMDFEVGSGNVFADLGLPDADELLAKAHLVFEIKSIIRTRKLTQAQAAELCGLDQPKMSKLLNAKLYGFSTDQLMHVLTSLGSDIEIVVTTPARKSTSKGKLTVRAA